MSAKLQTALSRTVKAVAMAGRRFSTVAALQAKRHINGMVFRGVAPRYSLQKRGMATGTEIVVNHTKPNSPTALLFQTLANINKQTPINFPRIVVTGNQSAGKTSLSEAMMGIEGLLEKKTGMATRRPTHVQLVKTAAGGDCVKIGSLSERVFSVEEARNRIAEENSGEVTAKPLEITIYSQNVLADGVFVDLPGFITTAKNDEDPELPKRIKDICTPYIQDPMNIKMVVLSATEDTALSYALNLVKRHGEMKNALGVYTKIDMIVDDRVGTKNLLERLNDRSYIPHLGVVGVKLRSPADLKLGVTIQQMLKNEQKFVTDHGLGEHSATLGVPTLMNLVSREQIKRIAHIFPQIKVQMEESLRGKKYSSLIMEKLATTNKITGIARELERIITDLHPLSPIRGTLEGNIRAKVSDKVVQFVTELGKEYKADVRPEKVANGVGLGMMRGVFSATVDPSNVTGNILGENFMYGECQREMTVPEMDRMAKEAAAVGLMPSFVSLKHSSEAKTSADAGTRTEYMRSIAEVVDDIADSTLIRDIIAIVNSELKEFVMKGRRGKRHMAPPPAAGDAPAAPATGTVSATDLSEESAIANAFFVHVFDKLVERSDKDGLANSIRQMLLAEKRPDVDITEMSQELYKLTRPMIEASVTASPGFLAALTGSGSYPVALPLYSSTSLKAYINILGKRFGKNAGRMLAVNLLMPLITNAIEISLKTIQNKDFSKEKKEMDKLTQELEDRIAIIQRIMDGEIQLDSDKPVAKEAAKVANKSADKPVDKEGTKAADKA